MTNRRRFLTALLAPPLFASPGEARPESSPAPTPSMVPPWPEENDPAFWDRIRDQFYITPGEAFFNTGTIGATPRPVLERVIEDMRTLQATVTRWDYTANTDRKSTRLNSSHLVISYAVFCLKKKKNV